MRGGRVPTPEKGAKAVHGGGGGGDASIVARQPSHAGRQEIARMRDEGMEPATDSESESQSERPSEAPSSEQGGPQEWRYSSSEPHMYGDQRDDPWSQGLALGLQDELGYRWWRLKMFFRWVSKDRSRSARFTAFSLFLLWCFVASVLLVVVKATYEGGAADAARLRYASSCAERVAAEAASVLSSALVVYDTVHYMVQRKRYFEPLDYGEVSRMLVPLFAAHGALRAVDLAFVGRNFSFSARRLWRRSNASAPNFTEPVSLIQSSFSDCFERLGDRGCLASVPGRDRPWYHTAAELLAGQESESLGRTSYVPVKPSLVGAAFRWLDGPRMVQRDKDTVTRAGGGISDDGTLHQSSFTWEPAYSMAFRSVFPGSSGALSVVGRSVLRLEGLAAGGRLLDTELLGRSGAICILDRTGTLIATAVAGDLLLVQAGSGRPRFRKVWELDTAWARGLEGRDLGAGGVESVEAEGFLVVAVPLPGRGLSHFRVVVAAELRPFVDVSLVDLLDRGTVAVALPYPSAVTIFLLWWGYKKYKEREALGRVYPEPEPDLSMEDFGRSFVSTPSRGY